MRKPKCQLFGKVLKKIAASATALRCYFGARSYTGFMKNFKCRPAPLKHFTAFLAFISLATVCAAQPVPINYKLTGDLGVASYSTQGLIRSKGAQTPMLPYVFADYGPFFARVDTVGFKALPFGNGYVELIGRVSQEGWQANTAALTGLKDRKAPLPVGVGTFQKTSYGAFMLNAFVDAGPSRGGLFEATYLAEIKLGSLSLYPQVGIESRSAKYANYYYGVTPAESLASGYAAYNAGASTTPVLGLAADYSLTDNWVVNVQLRRKWLDSAVTNSPLVVRKTQDLGYVGLSYRFK